MAFRRRAPLPPQVEQAPPAEAMLPSALEAPLVEAFDEFSVEAFINEHEAALQNFSDCRQDSKIVLNESLAPEWNEGWRQYILHGSQMIDERAGVPVDFRRERRVNEGNLRIWAGKIQCASMAARLFANADAGQFGAYTTIAASGVDAPDSTVSATHAVHTYLDSTDPYRAGISPTDTASTSFPLKEREVYDELCINYTNEELASAEVISALTASLNGSIENWEAFELWVADHADPKLKQIQSNQLSLMRVVAEDIHDPQRGQLAKAYERIVQENITELTRRYIEELPELSAKSGVEKAAQEAVEFAATLLGVSVDDEAFAGKLLAAKDAWPQTLRQQAEKYYRDHSGQLFTDLANQTHPFHSTFGNRTTGAELLQHMENLKNPVQLKGQRGSKLGRAAVSSAASFEKEVEEDEPRRTMTPFTGGLNGSPAVPFTDEIKDGMIKALMKDVGPNAQLEADARRILDSVLESPFEKGTTKISEVGKITISLPGEDVPCSIYRVNAAHRRISKSNKKSYDLRVLFAQSDGNISILSMTDHDDYEAAIRKLRKL